MVLTNSSGVNRANVDRTNWISALIIYCSLEFGELMPSFAEKFVYEESLCPRCPIALPPTSS